MDRYRISLLGISEMRWTGIGYFPSESHDVYYSGHPEQRRNGVGFIVGGDMKKSVLGYNPVNDRIISIRFHCKPLNLTVIQVYAPTSTADDADIEEFYEQLQQLFDETPNGDMTYIMGDLNAKVGTEEIPGVTGKFGLGALNERGERLLDFCSANRLSITNTKFKQHPRRLYTWTSPDQVTRNQIDYLICQQRWESSVKNAKTLPGADCNSDHQLLVANLKLQLAKLPKKTNVPIGYD